MMMMIIIIIIIIIIGVAVPAERNVQKDTENELKYKSLCTETQRMWNLVCLTLKTYDYL